MSDTTTLVIAYVADGPQDQPHKIEGATLEGLHNQWCERSSTFSGGAHPVPVRLTDSSGKVYLVNPAAIACAWEEHPE